MAESWGEKGDLGNSGLPTFPYELCSDLALVLDVGKSLDKVPGARLTEEGEPGKNGPSSHKRRGAPGAREVAGMDTKTRASASTVVYEESGLFCRLCSAVRGADSATVQQGAARGAEHPVGF